jgi:hypothetical protein
MMKEIMIAGQFRVWVEEAPSGSAWRVKRLWDSGPNASNAVIVEGIVGASVRLIWPDGISHHAPGEDPPLFNYYDEHGDGPYMIDVDAPSDMVHNVALVPGIGYQHVNIEYEWTEGEPEPPPPPGDDLQIVDEQGDPLTWEQFEGIFPGVEHIKGDQPCYALKRIIVRQQPPGGDLCPLIASTSGHAEVAVILQWINERTTQLTDADGYTVFYIPENWRQAAFDPMGNLSIGIKGSDALQGFRRVWMAHGAPDIYPDVEFEWVGDAPVPEPLPGDCDEKLDALLVGQAALADAVANTSLLLVSLIKKLDDTAALLEAILCELGKIVECECNDG